MFALIGGIALMLYGMIGKSGTDSVIYALAGYGLLSMGEPPKGNSN